MKRLASPEERRRLWHALPVGGLLLIAAYFLPWYQATEPVGLLSGWRFLGSVMWSEHPNPLLQPFFDVCAFWPLLTGALAFFFWTWGFPPRWWMRGMAGLGLPLLGMMRFWFAGLAAIPLWGLGVVALGYGTVLVGTWGAGSTRPLT